MRDLILGLLIDPSLRSTYAPALEGLDVDLRLVSPGAGSAVNERYVLDAPGPGTRLERLARRMGAKSLDEYDRVMQAVFSAGYGAARVTIEEPASVERLAAIVALDAWHDGLTFPRLSGLEAFARLAVAGERVLWLAHTDVPTPQKPYVENGVTKQPFASTQQVARELCRRIGIEPPALPELGAPANVVEHGGLRIAAYNTRSAALAGQEHSQALVGWGPWFTGHAVRRVQEFIPSRSERPTVPTPMPFDPKSPPGMRCLVWSITQLGVSEGTEAGQNVINGYHAEVGGKGWLTWQNPWCASFASTALKRSARPGDELPHVLTFRVRDMWESAIQKKTAVGISAVRKDPKKYLVPGNLLIMSRGARPQGEGALAFSNGHVGRIEAFEGTKIRTVDGNKGDKVARFGYDLSDPMLVGVILYPGGDTLDSWEPTEEELEEMIMAAQTAFESR